MKNLLLIFVLLLACQVRAGDQFWVGNDGDDASAGTSPETAWQTLLKVGTTLVAGDTIMIMGGTYDEDNTGFPDVNGTLKFTNAGTLSDSIFVFGAPDSTRPIIYGNSDPASTTHRWNLHLSEANDYFKFRFLKFEYGHKAVFLDGADYITFEDCISTHNISTVADENGGGWLVGWNSSVSKGIVWYNCEAGPGRLGTSWNLSVTDQNLSGWHLYKLWYSVIDSCRLTESGDSLQAGVFFKVNGYRDTVRNCFFDDGATCSIRGMDRSDATASYVVDAEDSCGQIYIHHNVFANSSIAILPTQSAQAYAHVGDTMYFYNNTIYGMARGGLFYGASEQAPVDSIWKYHNAFNNLYVNTPLSGAEAAHNIDEINFLDFSTIDFDYNVFFGGLNNVGNWDDGGNTNLATWQSNSGEDANSQYLNPYLVDTAGGDFTMTDSTPAFVSDSGTTVDGYGSSYIGAFDTCGVQGGDNSSCASTSGGSKISGTASASGKVTIK